MCRDVTKFWKLLAHPGHQQPSLGGSDKIQVTQIRKTKIINSITDWLKKFFDFKMIHGQEEDKQSVGYQ